MEDRRICPRWQVNLPAKIKLGQKEWPDDCYVTDINFKGIRVSLEDAIPVDKFVSLIINLPGDYMLDVEAWVAWHKTVEGLNTYGLYFSRIKDADREKIYRFVKSNFPKQVVQKCWPDLKKEEGGVSMEDRRIFSRFQARFPVRFLGVDENREGQAEVFDISAKGLGLVTKEQLQARAKIEMWLQIPDKGEPLYSRGEVIWVTPQVAGGYRAGINLERANLMGLSRALRAV